MLLATSEAINLRTLADRAPNEQRDSAEGRSYFPNSRWFIAVQQLSLKQNGTKQYENLTSKKINRPIAYAARFTACPANLDFTRFAAHPARPSVCLALPPQAGAVCEEGCDTNSNTFLGDGALSSTTTGVGNTATGSGALFRNTEGSNNTASGSGALTNNTTGSDNTAIGIGALSRNTTANSNTATGAFALTANTTGYRNTAIGDDALFRNTTGLGNTATGFQALYQNLGSNNIGLGFNAGSNLTTGSGNVCIGSMLWELRGESNTTRISNIYSSLASAPASLHQFR